MSERTFTPEKTDGNVFGQKPEVFDRHTAAMNDGTRMHIDIFQNRVRIIAESRTGRYGQPIALSDLSSCAVTIQPANEPPLRGYRGTDDGLRVPTARFEPKTSALLWPRESVILAKRLAEADESFTASHVDDAIQASIEALNARDDLRIAEITANIWLEISEDVADQLGIDHDLLTGAIS